MYGKTRSYLRSQNVNKRLNLAVSIACAALLLAIAGLFTPSASVFSALLPSTCSTGLNAASADDVVSGDGVDGISAYAVWLNQGNTGDEAAFLKDLVGVKGESGYTGANGKSAFQLWLDAGNSGSSEDFLQAIVGNQGAEGVPGLSAYELWLSTGQNGSLQNFLNTLTGSAGATGASGSNGANGLSAFEIWRDLPGNSNKTVVEFLAELKGASGSAGANGQPGTNGLNGIDGSPGPQGLQRLAGTKGNDGVCTIGVGGHFGYFWDDQTQTSVLPTNGMLLGHTETSDGVTLVNDEGSPLDPGTRGSWLKFDEAGTYNIAFSAQLAKTGGSADLVSIWLQRYNSELHNVEYSNTNLGMANNSTELVAAWNFFVVVGAGDRVRIAWHASNATSVISAHSPVTNGIDIPGTPSVIVTVSQVR